MISMGKSMNFPMEIPNALPWFSGPTGAAAHAQGDPTDAALVRWCRSVADGEAALDEARQFGLVDKGDGGVFHGDTAAPFRVEYRLVAADSEPARTFAGCDVLRGAEVGPQPVGGAQDVQGVAVAAHRGG